MYLRFVRNTPGFFGHPPKTDIIYTNLAHVVSIEVSQKTVCLMKTNGYYTNYKFIDNKNAQKMAERIIAYQKNPVDNYLDIVEGICPNSSKKVYKQRMDQPGPDIDALMILQEYDKSLMVIKDQNKNSQLK